MQNTQTTTVLRRAGIGLSALAMVGALAACGNSTATSSSSTSASASTSTPTASSPASSSASASATPTKKPTVVKNLDAIKVTPTTVGKKPTVTGAWPLAITSTQVKTLTQGTGAVVKKNAYVRVNYSGLNAQTGKVFDSTFDPALGHAKPATFSLKGVVAGFTKAIEGQKVGSRVVVFMTAKDGYGPSGGNAQAGIGKDDNLIFVIDILAQDTAVAPKAGFPKVTLDSSGYPVVAKPSGAAPKASSFETLVKGPGDKVTAANRIQVGYRVYDWATGKLLEDGYTQQAGAATVSQLPKAMQAAIVGQTVGSRVLVILPPSSLPTPSASPSASATPNTQTLVYVMDIQAAG